MIGGFFAIGGVFLSSFMTSYYAFVIIYPVLFGLGIGFSYMAPMIAGWEYFPTKRGLISGVIVGGFGFGSFIFSFISLATANPSGEVATLEVAGGKIFPPDSEISSNAPFMLRINCAIWLGLLLVSLPVLRRKEKPLEPVAILDSHDETSFDSQDQTLLNNIDGKQTIEIVEPTFMQSILDYRTPYIWLMIVLSSSYPYYIASNFKIYEQIDVPDEKFITIVGSIGAVVNGLSRGFWAALQDKVGFKIVYLSLLGIEIIVAFTFVAIHKTKVLYLIWVLLSFATLGGHFSIFPTVCAKIYGPTTGGKIYSVIFTAFATATLSNWILSKQTSSKNIDYDVLFYILASMAAVAFIMAIFFKDQTKVQIKDKTREILSMKERDILNTS